MSNDVDNKIVELGAVIHLDHTADIHKSFPCEFFQNPRLSSDAIALGGYLHSLPSSWIPRRENLMKHFDWGKWVWDKACGELRAEGYMKFKSGGKGGGTALSFSIYKNFPDVKPNKVINKRQSGFSTVGFFDSRKTRPHRYININENISKSIYKEHKHTNAFLESDIAIKLKKWGWYPGKIVKEINKHGMHVISYQVGLIEEGHKANPVNNLGGALTAQLKLLEKKDE